MNRFRAYAYSNFLTGAVVTTVCGITLISLSFAFGKIPLFLALNNDLGSLADNFFSLCTHGGDGTVWLPVAAIFWIYKRDKFPLLVSVVAIGTLIVQLSKNVFLSAQVRPATAIGHSASFHSVPGVELLTNNSFPSGHTTTAFSLFLLGCLFIEKKWIVPIGLLYALLVGYSRVYLAEHFPLDVGGGMLTAVVTLYLSVEVQYGWEHRKKAVGR